MEEEARKRKERLEAMRKRKLASSATNNRSTEEVEEKVKDLKFRSYTPNDEKLKEHVQTATPDDIVKTIEKEMKDIPDAVLKEAAEKEKEEVDLFNLAPKKANWDLRRDVEKKLEKLDRRTQKAILELIRQRLKEEDNYEEAIANAEAQTKLDAKDDEDGDDE
ncbi:mRNA splicing factor [Cunninghamella echinulata]|nr:mRNA splicing factor [Cunninghamella echinulata]